MWMLVGVVIAGLIGVAGHWLTRWQQGRTESTFKEYLLQYKAHTVQSFLANLTSSFTIYATVPQDLAGKQFILVLIGAYMAGYTLDSKLNKDTCTTVKELPDAKQNNKSLADVLSDDSKY